jgi:hypothetical protein
MPWNIGMVTKAMKILFQNWIKYIKNKISKGKKHEKRKQPQEKSSTSGKKIKLTIWNDSGVEANPHFDWEKNLYSETDIVMSISSL